MLAITIEAKYLFLSLILPIIERIKERIDSPKATKPK